MPNVQCPTCINIEFPFELQNMHTHKHTHKNYPKALELNDLMAIYCTLCTLHGVYRQCARNDKRSSIFSIFIIPYWPSPYYVWNHVHWIVQTISAISLNCTFGHWTQLVFSFIFSSWYNFQSILANGRICWRFDHLHVQLKRYIFMTLFTVK